MAKQNMYNFKFDSVSEEDIIRGAIESGVAVYLHGRSSEGKSARVKELDPDLIIIYLRNASLDSLNGKSAYNQATGEMIDIKPSWLVKLEKKCNEEPDKIHIVFFDELPNALHTIQGMAMNIILNREVNGKWKLPRNARVVAAGNEISDSMAANTLIEPLFNRFAHVYIHTTLDAWLEWAKTPKSTYQKLPYTKDEYHDLPIHPAIHAFITSKAKAGIDVLRTKYDGIKPNADPRKWEMASSILYKVGNPEMLRSLVGENITKEFVEFCKTSILTVEDVLNHNYTNDDIEGDVAKKYAIVASLANVDEDHLDEIRDFVKKMGLEMLTAFDNYWADGDPKKEEILEELRKRNIEWVKRI